jgi:nitrogen regulatory protein PII
MNTPAKPVPNLDYTRLVTCIMYEGGAVPVLEMLQKRGINEAYFYSVRGAPIGRSSEVSGLPEIPKTEILHAVVSADQADYIYEMIYDMAELGQPNRGVVYVNRLARSTPFDLPDEATLAAT